jgi:hypothetical protein
VPGLVRIWLGPEGTALQQRYLELPNNRNFDPPSNPVLSAAAAVAEEDEAKAKAALGRCGRWFLPLSAHDIIVQKELPRPAPGQKTDVPGGGRWCLAPAAVHISETPRRPRMLGTRPLLPISARECALVPHRVATSVASSISANVKRSLLPFGPHFAIKSGLGVLLMSRWTNPDAFIPVMVITPRGKMGPSWACQQA